jgi:hypothetical protein
LRPGLDFSISDIASPINLPMVGCLALYCRWDQRAPRSAGRAEGYA